MSDQVWVYLVPGDDGVTPITVTMTEAEILRDYFPYWKTQMIKAGKSDLISEQHCVEDWVVIHWAWRP